MLGQLAVSLALVVVGGKRDEIITYAHHQMTYDELPAASTAERRWERAFDVVEISDDPFKEILVVGGPQSVPARFRERAAAEDIGLGDYWGPRALTNFGDAQDWFEEHPDSAPWARHQRRWPCILATCLLFAAALALAWRPRAVHGTI